METVAPPRKHDLNISRRYAPRSRSHHAPDPVMDTLSLATAPGPGPSGGSLDPLMVKVVATVGALGFLAHLAFVPLFLWLGLPWMAVVNVVSAAVWALGWVVNQRGYQSLAVSLMTAEVIVFTVLAVSVLGLQSGFQYYMFGGIPFTLFITKWRGEVALAVAGLMVAVFVGLHLTAPATQFAFPSPGFASALHLGNALVAFSAIGLASYYFRDATIRARAKLQALAVTDGLTGVLNRRRASEILGLELTRSARTGQPFSIVLGEVDQFNGFVDGHGRECGDHALTAVARTISSGLREFDAVGRWGGAEFLVLLPGEDLDGAERVAETLRAAVAETQIDGICGGTRVTMTFGVAQGRPRDEPRDMVARVDAALYRGKELGQNAVFRAEEAGSWTLNGIHDGPGGTPQPASEPA